MAPDHRDALDKAVHELPEPWAWEWFTDVMDVEGGTQPPASEFIDSPRPGYVRLIQIRDFESDNHITYIPDSSKWRKSCTSDVLIARYGASLGRICTGLEGAYNVALAKVVPSDRISLRFAHYLLKSNYFQGPLLAGGGRSAQAGFNKDGLSVIPLPIPPLPEQRAIAHILGTLDDKIELNRRMNETLEAMARALFKSWFVDFDPVRAKAKGRDPGLPEPLADLFPAGLVDSELGEIPAGWEVGTLADFSSLNPEAWSKETRPVAINYVDLSNTKWGRIGAVTAYAQQGAPSRAQRVLRPRDTIVGTVRPGNGSYAFLSEEGLTGSTGFAVLRPLRIEYAELVYFAATAAENIEELSHLADGGAYPAVRPEVVAATQAIKSGDAVIERFSRIAGSLLAKIAENERESRTLAALRDTLLPKLISGEVRMGKVPELSSLCEDASRRSRC